MITQQAAETLLDISIALSLGARAFEALRIRLTKSRVLFSDALSTLRTLRERGYVLGVATNRPYGGELFLEDLREMGLLAMFTPKRLPFPPTWGYGNQIRRSFSTPLPPCGWLRVT